LSPASLTDTQHKSQLSYLLFVKLLKNLKYSKVICVLSLCDFHVATATEEDCRQWMRLNKLLATETDCPKCGTGMHESIYARVQDSVIWRCRPKTCRTTVSIWKGSFFDGAHLQLQKLLDVAYYWAIEVTTSGTKQTICLFFLTREMFF